MSRNKNVWEFLFFVIYFFFPFSSGHGIEFGHSNWKKNPPPSTSLLSSIKRNPPYLCKKKRRKNNYYKIKLLCNTRFFKLFFVAFSCDLVNSWWISKQIIIILYTLCSIRWIYYQKAIQVIQGFYSKKERGGWEFLRNTKIF